MWEGRGKTEYFPLILPDSPGAWEVGVSPHAAEGGPAGAQELGYFCNTEHICSQPQRRSNSGRRAGMQGARRWGELWFHPFWQLGGPLQSPLGKVGLVGQGGTWSLVLMTLEGGWGMVQNPDTYCTEVGKNLINSKVWGH